MRTLALLIAAAGTVFAATPAAPAADTVRLFHVKCGGCHGIDGGGGIGPSLKGKLSHPASAQLFEVIKNGIPGTQMPPSGLPDEQVKKLAAFVQYVSKKH
ncbi:c-type cytochrome [Nevskia soli]|jgi:mono/diheme cytochrome c family protein|uniref:c-type cytochrome n=1 Tax=Nevskia soli TaxID=418856 RepID=UPI0015D84BF2|nr:cytochrome c [Nevskia soli]